MIVALQLTKNEARAMFPDLPYLWNPHCCVVRKKDT